MLRAGSRIMRLNILRDHLRGQTISPCSTASLSDGRPGDIKAVIFDMGGVIVPSPGPLFKVYEEKHGLPRGTILAVLREGGAQSSWSKLECGEYTLTEFGQRFSEECSSKVGRPVDMSGLLPNGPESVKFFKPYPQVVKAIEKIHREGYKIALLTNNWKVEDTTHIPFDKSLFDVIIESCVVGMRKPDPRIYDLCLQRLQVSPQQTLFLDDLGVNLKPAKQIGMQTVQVTSPDQAVAELQKVLGIPLQSYDVWRGTEDVPERLQIPIDKLTVYLNSLGIHSNEPPVLRTYKHGQSNPTYLLQYGGRNLVLRKKPPGKLLPSAHAVEREYMVMKAVGGHNVPVPPVLSLCEDPSIIGTPFYLMDHVPGNVYTDLDMGGASAARRSEIFSAMCEVLAKIHSVDIKSAGLDNFGKQGDYVKRNFARWAKQYEASKTHEIPSMTKLMDWISQRFPTNERISVIHGDFRMDNLIYGEDSSEVKAVLDWELATLGDPLTDLAVCCLSYYLPPKSPLGTSYQGVDNYPGTPSVEDFLSEYCHHVNIPSIDNWEFYVAFVCFRGTAILQGVYKRAISGQSSSPDAKVVGKFAEKVADVGWEIASKSSIRPTITAGSKSNSGPPAGSRQYSTAAKWRPEYHTTRKLSTTPSAIGAMPITVSSLSPRVQEFHKQVKDFMEKYVFPFEKEAAEYHSNPATKWTVHPKMEQLKEMAKAKGLWNLFLPKESDPEGKFGAGLTNLEYAFLCEEMGKSGLGPEVFNCSAPDTGNMEVLVRYGTPEQQQQWLKPLLEGKIRSCFGMTEPQVASSDATNIESSIERQGDEYVINGRKWWTSGALDPRCKVCIFMGKTERGGTIHKQQSMVLVPMDAPGVKIIRALSVFGSEDPPAGHAEMLFENVRIPLSNVLLGEGRGFEIAQGRLGPGRIHHCMRLIGGAERALELMVDRVQNRVAFGKTLAEQGTIQADIAQSRIEIEQTRLLVLKAAHVMDVAGNKVAAPEIAMIKVAAPNMGQRVVDRCIQAFGGAGVSHDFPMANYFAWARVLRLADGPDEVHRRTIAKMELRKTHRMSKL